MALTPEDVVNKRFNPTKFREGYDQDEVDDFLDEVVVELRRLGQENEELRQRLVAGEARINELQRSGGGSSDAASAPVSSVPAPVAAEPAAAEPTPAPVPTPAPAQDSTDLGGTNNLLQLARRLHEEHVREGIEKRDALIAEGHATAARVVSEAQEAQRAQLGAFESTKAGLESEIEQLKAFESEYRGKLKGYIEGQLRELENSASIGEEPGVPATSAPAPAFGGEQYGQAAPAPVSAWANASAPAPASASAPGSAAAPASASAPASAAAPGSAAAPSGGFASAAAPFGQVPEPGSAPAPSSDRPGFAGPN